MTKKKPKELHKKNGAPEFPYTLQLAKKICRAVSTCADGLTKICHDNPDFPSPSVIYEWRLDHPEFAEMYHEAKKTQADLLVEEIREIADDTSRDTLTKYNKDGEEYEVCNTEWIARSRLRVDTRKWLAAKLIPRVYGEKVQTESTVTIKHEDLLKELK